MINPLDTVVKRVKISQKEGVYYGYMSIPEDIPGGLYTLRVYTTFMRNQNENYFCTKAINIVDPRAGKVHIYPIFTNESNKRVNVELLFSHINDSTSIIPQSVKVSINGEKTMKVNIDQDGVTSINFDLQASLSKRIMLLEAEVENKSFRQFIQIPVCEDDFDISFYPEGGSLMLGTTGKVAFKAMKNNGQSTNISGIIYDSAGNKIVEFKSVHAGMGSFSLLPEKDNNYYAICVNDSGESKRFDLPTALDYGYSLSVNCLVKDRVLVSVLQSTETIRQDELYLLAHTRGMVHFVHVWDFTKNVLSLSKDNFPSGIMHLILFDSDLNPVSERLVFINNADQAQTICQSDRTNFTSRSLVNTTVTVTDNDGLPLIGSFSVSITSDQVVETDSTKNILTQLLLSSDLRGYIENPAYYFQNTTASAWMLDLLMCTQGWRRYPVSEMAKGIFTEPTYPLEVSTEISGLVKNGMTGKPVEKIKVTAMSMKNGYIDVTQTNKYGRFVFYNSELPDSALLVVSASPKKGIAKMMLTIEEETFPKVSLSTIPAKDVDRKLFAQYAKMTEQKYVFENGIRTIQLPEVIITTEKKEKRKSMFYSNPNSSFTREDIESLSSIPDVRELLIRMPGVFVGEKGSISIRQFGTPLLVVDDVPMGIDKIDVINPYDIDQIDILANASNTAPFGMQGGNGVIVIFTKRGKINNELPPLFHIQTIKPLGYQSPVEFYAPRYDTPDKKSNPTPDLRTTIHWQPDVRTDSLGMASFEFYTADEETSYTIIIEGLTDDGRIIRHEEKLWKK